jgi:hypothetical protein
VHKSEVMQTFQSNRSRLKFNVEDSFIFSAYCSRLQDNFVLVINDSFIVGSNINGRTMLLINTCFLLLSTIIFNLYS